jgi:hypothetical protein
LFQISIISLCISERNVPLLLESVLLESDQNLVLFIPFQLSDSDMAKRHEMKVRLQNYAITSSENSCIRFNNNNNNNNINYLQRYAIAQNYRILHKSGLACVQT